MISILINAYGCSPNRGSEQGLGWCWISELAKYCKVTVITESEFKDEINNELNKFYLKNNITFHFVDIGEKARKMCWNQGDWRFYYYYRLYQKDVYKLAQKLHKEAPFKIVHQLNMICYREPGYLWKLENTNFIWGPVGGFTNVPCSYFSSLSLKKAIFYTIKNILNWGIASFVPRIRKAAENSSLIFSASKESQRAIEKFYNKKSILLNETGFKPTSSNYEKIINVNKTSLDILWVGRFIPTKLLSLALKSLSYLDPQLDINFHILGDGNNKLELQNLAKKLKISEKCIWHGLVSKEKVQEHMQKADLLFFTSIVEGTSHAIMEAIANNLPILCFDTCGHGEIVNDKIGIKIPLSTPQKSAIDFAEIISILYFNREKLQILTKGNTELLTSLTWEFKAKKMYEYYLSIINNNN